jgi:hypothetical protein
MRKLFALILAVLMTAAFLGCTKEENTETGSDTLVGTIEEPEYEYFPEEPPEETFIGKAVEEPPEVPVNDLRLLNEQMAVVTFTFDEMERILYDSIIPFYATQYSRDEAVSKGEAALSVFGSGAILDMSYIDTTISYIDVGWLETDWEKYDYFLETGGSYGITAFQCIRNSALNLFVNRLAQEDILFIDMYSDGYSEVNSYADYYTFSVRLWRSLAEYIEVR